jgi:hypothetical protein
MIALACASHVLIDLPLFGAPVLILGGGVLWTARQERRRGRRATEDTPEADRETEFEPIAT